MPHLNNKQNENTNPTISRQHHPLTQPCPSEEKQASKQANKQTKTQHQSHPIQSHTNHWTNFRRAETKKKFNLEAWEKGTSNTIIKKKKKKEKAEKYYSNEGTN